MKKSLCFLLIIAMLAGFSAVGFADVILPPSESNEVTVVNPDGIKVSDDTVIPYGTVCHVTKFLYPDNPLYNPGDENFITIYTKEGVYCRVPIEDVDGECIRNYKKEFENYSKTPSDDPDNPDNPDNPDEEESRLDKIIEIIKTGILNIIDALRGIIRVISAKLSAYFG